MRKNPTYTLPINEEFHRIVLRKRWVLWMLKKCRLCHRRVFCQHIKGFPNA